MLHFLFLLKAKYLPNILLKYVQISLVSKQREKCLKYSLFIKDEFPPRFQDKP